jgi:hypothetical protein
MPNEDGFVLQLSDTGGMVELPRYKSHKTVWALEIKSVGGDYKTLLEFVEPGYAPVLAPREIFSRYKPVPGDFFVQYADGYQSFSPRKAFLEGYSPEKP